MKTSPWGGSEGVSAMLQVVRQVMPDKYRRRSVSAIRHFPKGCGRRAHPLDEKPLPEDAPSSEGTVSGKFSTLETPIAYGNMEPEAVKVLKQETQGLAGDSASFTPEKIDVAEVVDQIEVADIPRTKINGTVERPAIEMLKPEPHELPGPSGSSQPGNACKSLKDRNEVEVADLSETDVDFHVVKEGSKEENETNLLVKVEYLDLSKESSFSPNSWVLLKNSGFDTGVSKLYGPSKRRELPVVRHFPLGCGRNAASMSKEEYLRARAAMHNRSVVSERGLAVPRADELTELKKSDGEFGDSCDKQAQDCVGDVDRESQEEFVSKTALGWTVMEESIGKKVPAQEACKNIERPQENGREGGAGSYFRGSFNERIAEEQNKDTLVAPMGLEGFCKGAQGIYKQDPVKHVPKVELEEISEEEHFGQKGPPRVDNKQVDKKLQIRKAREYEISHLKAKTESQLCKVVVKKATDSVGKLAKMRKGIDVKGKIWKRLQAEQGGNTGNSELQGGELMSLDVYADKLIVQALMAAPNCPWRQGKHTGMVQQYAPTLRNKAKKEVRTPKRKSLSLETSPTPGNKAEKEVRAAKRKCLSFETSVHQPKDKSEAGEASLLEDEEDELPLAIYPETKELSVSVPPFGPSDLNHDGGCNDEVAVRVRVRRVLRLFQVLCRKLLQGEESKLKNPGQRIRVDLTAANILKTKNQCVNIGKPIVGSVPGVEVGDEFHYRAELTVVGLHRSYQSGIDWGRITDGTLAFSIVANVGHDDEMDSSDVLIYSGSGGSAAIGDKVPEDQKLERGNLGLKNCLETKSPVRVIRGIKELRCTDAQDGKTRPFSTFTYDGLYLVEHYWLQEGPQGFSIFKFRLKRIPGQPEIALKEIKKSKKSAVREGLCISDISDGKEKIPISVVNTIDDERPAHFVYVTKMIYPSSHQWVPPNGCDCTKRCSDSESCVCEVKNGGEIPFNFTGAIVQAKPIVYECGPSCKCPPYCHNRISQHGIRIQLEIFKTRSMGWGVRSLTSIPSGSFICEYIGELIQDKEAEQRNNDEYLFHIGHNYVDNDLWEGLSTLIPDPQSSSHSMVVEEAGFTIDAAKYGNVGRFINHSCSPNLFAQHVLYDHDDKRMPHIMFFAAENIPPLQELTYHYNYTIGQVRDADGNMKTKDCHCGSLECSGRLY